MIGGRPSSSTACMLGLTTPREWRIGSAFPEPLPIR
jgi:hypothetical protein